MTQENKWPLLKLAFFIFDWTRLKTISPVFEAESVRYQFVFKGQGTASSDILDLLGIGASDKAVILCLELESKVPILLSEVRKIMHYHGPGAGVGFTVPLSGINNLILKDFIESADRQSTEPEEQKGVKMSSEIKFDVIFTIVNQGYTDNLMTAAREAGATGGTVINGRGLTTEGAVKFFGVSVQPEREIVMILTDREKKMPIMQAISQGYGINSEAAGIVFSLPVDEVIGLNFE